MARSIQSSKRFGNFIVTEAAELLECFQWKTDEIALKENREELLKEVADVLIYALQIAESMGADGEELVRMKLAENRRRTWPKK